MQETLAPTTEASSARGFVPILALTLSAFAIGTAEFVIAGLLPDIARDLRVSIPAAGQLVTAYAVGVVVGAPLTAILTSRLPRKRVLLLMLGIFIAGNLCSTLAPGYALLMIARVLAAFAHGSLFGVGAVVATELVPPSRRATANSRRRSIAPMLLRLGMSAATAMKVTMPSAEMARKVDRQP